MIRPRVVAIATGLLVAGTVAVAQAQTENKHKREGFWFALSAGAASVGVSCDGCTDDRQIGPAGNFRLGFTVHPTLLLGLESDGWLSWENNTAVGDITYTQWALTAVAFYYPSVRGGFWLEWGVGFSIYRENADLAEVKSTGGAILFGAGYDIRLVRNFSLAPYLHMIVTLEGNLKVDGVDTGLSTQVDALQVGLSAVFH